MNIYINGEQQQTDCKTLMDLIQNLALESKRYAVEVNEMIIPKSRLAETPICEADKIEIIHAVGGG
ncbi:sulfur carrier protein ThiS [Acinetobacter sp. HR7]|uniref:sulfur carrier protein ThiS n=1 Tax=Acinetobacter sp. HR7 TaxID=1509403 RepID=UPI000536F8E7|nr:sulfur carrier protein ThiS [Acinetobacter sp. HR7]KGT46500.1 thiazole biosynthesis protein ThiF [Acinetobacter sp. HR7]